MSGQQEAVTGGWDYGDGRLHCPVGWRGRDRWSSQSVNAVLMAPLFAWDAARNDGARAGRCVARWHDAVRYRSPVRVVVIVARPSS